MVAARDIRAVDVPERADVAALDVAARDDITADRADVAAARDDRADVAVAVRATFTAADVVGVTAARDTVDVGRVPLRTVRPDVAVAVDAATPGRAATVVAARLVPETLAVSRVVAVDVADVAVGTRTVGALRVVVVVVAVVAVPAPGRDAVDDDVVVDVGRDVRNAAADVVVAVPVVAIPGRRAARAASTSSSARANGTSDVKQTAKISKNFFIPS